MKHFSVILLLVVFAGTIQAQDNSFDCNTQELIKLTIDTSSVYNIRTGFEFDLLPIERKGFKRECDSIGKVFVARYELYYQNHYSNEEIVQFLNFCKTKTGKKFASDSGKLYNRKLPENKTLLSRLVELNKTYRNWQPGYETISTSGHANIDSLISIMDVQQHLDALKAAKLMHIEPRFEADYVKAFDKMANTYLDDLKQYFRDVYTDAQLQEILQFFETPVGKKVAGNSRNLISVSIMSEDCFTDAMVKLHKNIYSGKFQREYFRENKE